MLNNSNGQSPLDPMASPGNGIDSVPEEIPTMSPVQSAVVNPNTDQAMASDILDLDNASNMAANSSQPMTAPNMAPVVAPLQATASPMTPPAQPMAAPDTEAVDMFDGIPSLSTSETGPAAPVLSNADRPAGRPEKKMSIVGILLIVIIVIALIGGALAAYNFWQNSAKVEDDAMIETIDETTVTDTTTDLGAYDFTEDENLVDTLPTVEDNGELGYEDDLMDIDISDLDSDIVLPPLSGDVLDYEEVNEENMDEVIVLPEDLLFADDGMTEEMIEEQMNEDFSVEEAEGMIEDIGTGDQEVVLPEDMLFEEAEMDLDNDGLTNQEEADLGTNPYKADSDNDGLNDREEIMVYGTDPMNPDTDGDSYLDGAEVAAGYNPNGEGKLLE